jgi:hypothetical protein
MTIEERIKASKKQYSESMEPIQAKIRELYDTHLAELKQIQSECPHDKIKHHPDLSGNHDSWDECARCGKEGV